MNWVIVIVDGDKVQVLGMFDSEESAETYLQEVPDSVSKFPLVAIRPILPARPTKL